MRYRNDMKRETNLYHVWDQLPDMLAISDSGYRGEACQHLDLDLVDLEVKGYFRIRKVQPEV